MKKTLLSLRVIPVPTQREAKAIRKLQYVKKVCRDGGSSVVFHTASYEDTLHKLTDQLGELGFRVL